VLLNFAAALAWAWFGPISHNSEYEFRTSLSSFAHGGTYQASREFGITLDQVNWLGNIMSLLYLPSAFLVPAIISRWGLRRCVGFSVFCTSNCPWPRPSDGNWRRLPDLRFLVAVCWYCHISFSWWGLCPLVHWPSLCCHCPTNVPMPRLKVLGNVVRYQGKDDRYDGCGHLWVSPS